MVIPNASSNPLMLRFGFIAFQESVRPGFLSTLGRCQSTYENMCCVMGPGMLVTFLGCRGTFSGKMFGVKNVGEIR